MIFHCPNCHGPMCSGLSNREFIIIDEDKKLEGMMLCRCPSCNNKIRLCLEGVITQAIPVLEEN